MIIEINSKEEIQSLDLSQEDIEMIKKGDMVAYNILEVSYRERKVRELLKKFDPAKILILNFGSMISIIARKEIITELVSLVA